MKKRVIIILAIMACISISACQKTPTNTEKNENGVAVQQQEKKEGKESYQTVINDISEKQQWTCENEELTVEVDATIQLPDTTPECGVLKPKEISQDQVLKILDADADWQQSEDGYVVMLPESERREDTIDYSRYADFSQYGFGSNTVNTTEDQDLFPTDADTVLETDWDEEQRQYAEEAEKFIASICDELGTLYEPSRGVIYENAAGQRYIRESLSLCMGDISFCDLNSIASVSGMPEVSGEISMSGDSIGQFAIPVNYEKDSSEAANLLKWEDIVEIFSEQVESASIHFEMPTLHITNIQLQYLLSDDLSYQPVWCFYGDEQDGLLPYIPAICINACDGTVEYAL